MNLWDGVESHTVRPDTRGLWKADADTDLQDFSGRVPPKKLMFSLNGKCNLRCDHCARGCTTCSPNSHQYSSLIM